MEKVKVNINVLTLSWNGLDKLKRLRPGLIRNLENTKLPFTWYIRDNGSKDGTLDEIKNWEYVKVLSVDHNRDNFAAGVNSLCKKAREESSITPNDYYLLMNNDVEFVDDVSLSKMITLMKPDVGIVGARLLYNGTDKLQHAGVIFSKQYGLMPYHYRHKETSDKYAEQNRYFQAVTAAVCLVRAGDLDAIDGMDEKFHWAFEDIDMCLRIAQLGRKIVYCGETNIFHEESASLKKNPINKMFMGPNVGLFKKKWFGKYEIDHEKYIDEKGFKSCL